MLREGSSPYTLLLVEDEPAHQVLVKAVFARHDEYAHIQVVDSAEDAIAYLRGPWQASDIDSSGFPDVIVLDIRMAGIGGLGFLEWYSQQPNLAGVPVVVFTSADDAEVRRRCFELGASDYKVKPINFEELVDVVHEALRAWRAAGR